MLTTRHADWDSQYRLLRQHAMSVPDTVRHGANKVIFEPYSTVGYSYRLTDIQAAVGREQLKRPPEIVKQRRQLAARYANLLSGIEGLVNLEEPAWSRSNWQSYCVRLPAECSQRHVMQALPEAGIHSCRRVICTHGEKPYRDVARALPRSEQAQDRCILRPLYPQLKLEEQQQIASVLREACVSVAHGFAANPG